MKLSDLFSLKGKKAVVTGGGRGIGKFIATGLAEAGADIIVASRKLETLTRTAEEISGLGVRCLPVKCDMGSPEEIRSLVETAKKEFGAIDILVIKEIGKNFSGTGMDTNVVGRILIPRTPETHEPDVAVIAVLDIAAESHGNAAGIGLANVTTLRAVERIDWVATYTNSVTSGIFGMQRVGIPITMADDRRALEIAVRGCGEPPAQARWVFINNTSKLRQCWASPALRGEIEAQPHLRIVSEVPLAFDAQGMMRSPWDLAGSA